jgi:hypothetical protein
VFHDTVVNRPIKTINNETPSMAATAGGGGEKNVNDRTFTFSATLAKLLATYGKKYQRATKICAVHR